MSDTEMQAKEEHQPIEVEKTSEESAITCGEIVFFALSIVVGAFATIGLFTPWLTRSNRTSGTDNFLYLWRFDSVTGNSVVTVDAQDFCSDEQRRLKAAEAFAIVTVLLCACLILFATLKAFLKWNTHLLCILFAIFTFITMIITWAFMANLYLGTFCGKAASYKNSQYDIGTGLIIYIIGSVILFFAFFFYLGNPPLPSGNDQIKRACAIVFTLFAILSCIGTAIGIPITVWKYRDENDAVTEVSIWKTMANGVETLSSDDTCGNRRRLWYAVEVLSIIGFLVALLCVLLGGLRTCGKLGSFSLMFFGFLGSVILLIMSAILISLYYTQYCAGVSSYEALLFVRMPGYGLLIGGFCFLLAGTIVVAIGSFLTRTTKMSIWRFVSLLLVIDSMVLLCIAATQPQIGVWTGDDFQRLTLQTYETKTGSTFTTASIQDSFCNEISDKTSTAMFFLCFGIGLLFVSLILAIVALKKHTKTQRASAVFAFLAAVSVLIDFIIVASIYHRTYCGITFSDLGMQLSTGFGLSVAGAATAVGAWALNIFF